MSWAPCVWDKKRKEKNISRDSSALELAQLDTLDPEAFQRFIDHLGGRNGKGLARSRLITLDLSEHLPERLDELWRAWSRHEVKMALVALDHLCSVIEVLHERVVALRRTPTESEPEEIAVGKLVLRAVFLLHFCDEPLEAFQLFDEYWRGDQSRARETAAGILAHTLKSKIAPV